MFTLLLAHRVVPDIAAVDIIANFDSLFRYFNKIIISRFYHPRIVYSQSFAAVFSVKATVAGSQHVRTIIISTDFSTLNRHSQLFFYSSWKNKLYSKINMKLITSNCDIRISCYISRLEKCSFHLEKLGCRYCLRASATIHFSIKVPKQCVSKRSGKPFSIKMSIGTGNIYWNDTCRYFEMMAGPEHFCVDAVKQTARLIRIKWLAVHIAGDR